MAHISNTKCPLFKIKMRMNGSFKMRLQRVHSMDYSVNAIILFKKTLSLIILIKSVDQFKFSLTMWKALPALIVGFDVNS